MSSGAASNNESYSELTNRLTPTRKLLEKLLETNQKNIDADVSVITTVFYKSKLANTSRYIGQLKRRGYVRYLNGDKFVLSPKALKEYKSQ